MLLDSRSWIVDWPIMFKLGICVKDIKKKCLYIIENINNQCSHVFRQCSCESQTCQLHCGTYLQAFSGFLLIGNLSFSIRSCNISLTFTETLIRLLKLWIRCVRFFFIHVDIMYYICVPFFYIFINYILI